MRQQPNMQLNATHTLSIQASSITHAYAFETNMEKQNIIKIVI